MLHHFIKNNCAHSSLSEIEYNDGHKFYTYYVCNMCDKDLDRNSKKGRDSRDFINMWKLKLFSDDIIQKNRDRLVFIKKHIEDVTQYNHSKIEIDDYHIQCDTCFKYI